MTIAYPTVNGARFDFSSVEITVRGVKLFGVKSINYKHTLDPGIVRGNRAQVIGTTRGKYDADGNIELYKLEFAELMLAFKALNLGYMEARFDIFVTYAEAETAVVMDELHTCRIKSSEDSGSEGNEPSTVKCDLHIGYIIANGASPLSPGQLLK